MGSFLLRFFLIVVLEQAKVPLIAVETVLPE